MKLVLMEFIFTSHSKHRIQMRRLTEEEVIEAIRHPDRVIKKYGNYYAQKNIGRGTIEVPYEKTEKYIRIITVYWI